MFLPSKEFIFAKRLIPLTCKEEKRTYNNIIHSDTIHHNTVHCGLYIIFEQLSINVVHMKVVW